MSSTARRADRDLVVHVVMSLLCSLPDEVLKIVMKHVPLGDRLTSCCLVSRRLHAAATTATEQLVFADGSRWTQVVDYKSRARAQSVLEWLEELRTSADTLDAEWILPAIAAAAMSQPIGAVHARWQCAAGASS